MIELAKSLAGHDKGSFYLVVETKERIFFLANGTNSPLALPKKKNEKHIQIIKKLPGEVRSILEEKPITDQKVMKAIVLYKKITQS